MHHFKLLHHMSQILGFSKPEFLKLDLGSKCYAEINLGYRFPSYSSVEEHADFAREKFEEDVREGLMAKMTMGEFLERYGEHTAIAALAVIVEDEELDKKRIIHDATHGVRVNHRIKCRDKLRSPGAREKKHLLREHEEEGETAFSVVGDIAKAHRRYKHAAKEHGYLACQVDAKEEVPGDPASQTVYVNQVGTFGLSCASYWWTRIAACGLRLTYHLLGPDFPLDLLLYADDLEAMGKGPKGRRGIPLSYLFLATLGYPFKWAKTRGGFRVEWLGMETEYPTYKPPIQARPASALASVKKLNGAALSSSGSRFYSLPPDSRRSASHPHSTRTMVGSVRGPGFPCSADDQACSGPRKGRSQSSAMEAKPSLPSPWAKALASVFPVRASRRSHSTNQVACFRERPFLELVFARSRGQLGTLGLR